MLLGLVCSDAAFFFFFVSSNLSSDKKIKEVLSLQIGPQGQIEYFKTMWAEKSGVILTSRNNIFFFHLCGTFLALCWKL